MKQIFFALLLVAVLRSSAQSVGVLPPTLAVFAMPCQVLPLAFSGGFTAGAEARVYHHFSIAAEAGRFYASGYMGKVNFKCYIPDADSEVKYVAIELAYKRQSYTVEDNIKDNSGSYPEPGAPVDYSVAKTVKILNLKYGQLALSRHAFYVDVYGGVGIRYRDVTNDLLPGQTDNFYHWNEGFIDNFTNSEFKGYSLSLSAGIKIGFRYK